MSNCLAHALDLPLAPFMDGYPQKGCLPLRLVAQSLHLRGCRQTILQMYALPKPAQSMLFHLAAYLHEIGLGYTVARMCQPMCQFTIVC